MVLSVIIVNYNVKYFLEYCLYAVEKALEGLEGEVIVVDNNSSDGSKEFFGNKFPRVRFIWNTQNEGFARGCNRALLQAAGDYILFLNPDTILPEDCFEKCISFLKSHQNKTACGIKMLDGSGKFLKESKRAFPGPITSLFKLSGLARLFPRSRVFSRYHLGFLDENSNQEVDVLAGAFMMIPKDILTVVGGFDEAFFMYGEDIDLSYRIQKAGFKNYYFAESCIIHFKGESTRKGSLNYVRMFYKAMSVFVNKHYGGARAGIFHLLIQTAIFLRACLAAMARFLTWIGLPVIDAATILISFWSVKFLWSTFIRREVNYSSNLLIIAFPAFAILFLISSYFSGLYDNGYRQSRLNKSTVTAILVLLAAYSLLPESLRFSRGILFFGSLMAFLLMTTVRRILLKWRIIVRSAESDEINQTVIAGTENEFKEVSFLLQKAGIQDRILGRIDPGESSLPNSIGSVSHLDELLKVYPIKEFIFCEGVLSFGAIIAILPKLPSHIRTRFYAKGAQSLLGRGYRIISGTPDSEINGVRLNQPIGRRNKMLSDIMIACFFLLSFPVHLVFKSNPLAFLKNSWKVLCLKKTWIGYAQPDNGLQPLRPGVLTTTGLPAYLNSLPDESLRATDRVYAKNFKIANDIKILWLNYKFLS